MPLRRRDVLIAACAIGATIAVPRVIDLFRPEFTFEPIPGLPGFRSIAGGSMSSAQAVFAGIDPMTEQDARLRQEVAKDPCLAAFGPQPWAGGTVPIAVFTDYNCPYCPTLSGIIMVLIETGAPISVTWHEMPVLGPRSMAAARAAIAARAQGQYLPVHEHLMRSVLPPGPASLRALADRFDIEPAQFQRDGSSRETTQAIDRSSAVAAAFGIIGTPALLVGRTLVVGKIARNRLEKLIAVEQTDADPPCGTSSLD
ncbi:DsbA family protein [Sedimentitalea todarodis]|uniref:DsbA family protein n=1 Tax=Sedimentitalea todarodis TaxID=1631240 RepID=A0ABU3VD96_9RHOB|nr:DsbA family protein [Sedimentitalea todarodis]MDU9004136.1 DsbA family protein [Sedimentitalea todarodis]